MYELKSVGILRCGLVLAVVYAIGAFIESLFFVPIMALAPYASAYPFGGLGWAMVVVFPIFGAIFGLIAGIVGAAVYNLVARWTGGLQLRFAVEPGPEALSAS